MGETSIYAMIRIKVPTDKELPKPTIYFVNEDRNVGNELEHDKPKDIEWPLEVNKEVYFLDSAIWYHANPQFCIWWDKQVR